MKIFVAILMCLIFNVVGFAATLELKSGENVNGELISATQSTVQISVRGTTLIYPTTVVDAILFNDETEPESQRIVSSPAIIPPGSEITLQVISVRLGDNSVAKVILQSLEIVRLASGDDLQPGTLFEAHLLVPHSTDWETGLKFDRALDATKVYRVEHQPIAEISRHAEFSVLFGRDEAEIETLPDGVPDVFGGLGVIRVQFSTPDGDRNS